MTSNSLDPLRPALPAAPRPAPRRYSWRWLLVLPALAVSAGAGIWWNATRRPVVPLEPRWEAMVDVLAGTGRSGFRDGAAGAARFSDPFGVAVLADGTVAVSDAGEAQRIRAVHPDGRVTTLAGSVRGFADGDPGSARFDTPSALAIDAGGTLYVADTGNNAIRRITRNGRVSTLAGDGVAGDRDGIGREARFNGPVGVAVDAAGRVLVADTYNDRIRAIASDGTVTTIAGGPEPGAIDGAAAEARFDTPCGIAVDSAGRIYVADTGNGAVRMIDPAGGVTTLATDVDGTALRPIGIAAAAGALAYVADERGRIVEISGDGTGRSVAGAAPGFGDGAGGDARFRRPSGVALAAPGRLIVADTGNALIRSVAARSQLTARVPASPLLNPEFDAQAFGLTPLLWPVSPMEGPHEIAGTLGEARGGQGNERFHAGIDVRIEQGTPVRAVRDGVVANPVSTADFGSLNEWLRIGPIGYVHLRAGRDRRGSLIDSARFVAGYDGSGTIARVRVKRGARFAAGDVVGSVNAFNHVHLNVGWPGEEANPLRFRLSQFEDRVPPTIAAGGIRLYDERWQPIARRKRQPVEVSGRVRIVVDAWDQSDGNRPNRRLGLYGLGYQLLLRNGSPAPSFETARQTLTFDRLAVQADAARLVYAPGSGIPYYGGQRTRFLYVATNEFHGGAAVEGFWDASALPAGPYVLRVHVTDIRGNTAVPNRDLPVIVLANQEDNPAERR